MALKKSEKQLIGIMLLIGAGAAGFMLGLPNLSAIQTSWSRKSELDTQLKNHATAEASLQVEIDSLKQQMRLPNDIIIRKHTPANLQANVKEILNKIMGMASQNENTVISLVPWPEVPPILPPAAPASTTTPAATTPAASGAAPAANAPADPNAPPAPPPPPPLTVVGYELAVRGTFNGIQEFLKAMDSQKELVELSSIEIVNEQGPDRGASSTKDASAADKTASSDGPIMDPNKPIKLLMKLRLVLEPENGPVAQ